MDRRRSRRLSIPDLVVSYFQKKGSRRNSVAITPESIEEFQQEVLNPSDGDLHLLRPSEIATDMSPMSYDGLTVCQNPDCELDGLAVKVCHHGDCRDRNSQHPLSLCAECDERIHSDPEFRGHLRLDVHSKEKNGVSQRLFSAHSLLDSNNSETSPSSNSATHLDNGKMNEISVKDETERPVTPSTDTIDGTDSTDATAAQTAAKFKRKKVLKNRRPHTEDRCRSQSMQIERDQRNIPTVLLTRASTFDGKPSPPPSPRSSPFDPELEKHSISKECFTVKYDILSEPEIDILAAIKGVQLRDALAPYFAKRGIIMERIFAYLDASHTPLPLVIDTFPLGGSQLHIKAKDHNTSPFGRTSGLSKSNSSSSATGKSTADRMKQEKKISSGSLGRAQKKSSSSTVGLEDLFSESSSNSSPYNSLTAADSKKLTGRTSASKLGALFLPNFTSKDKDKQDQLAEQLMQYTLTGLPSWPSLLTLGEPHFDRSMFDMEKHWTDIIDKTGMTKKQRDQQEAVWELLNTEVRYVEALNVICDLFYCCLINLQNEQLLNEIETEKLFSNIREVRTATCQFWKDDLLKVLDHSRTNQVPLDPLLLLQGFSKFEDSFQPYTKYCLEQSACLEYMKTKFRDHDLFRAFVEWAEAHGQCNRLRLHDLVVKPMQRLTRYSLLLRAIVKKTDKESSKRELNKIIEHVDKFVRSVDSTLRQSHEAKRLAAIIDKIDCYDAVDLPNDEAVRALSPYSTLDLTCRMPGCGPRARRNLLMESALRLKEGNSKIDVLCLLFTDMLLVTKATRRGDKVKVIKPPLRVDRIKVQMMRDQTSFLLVHLSEYNVVSAAYLFQGEHIAKFVAMFMKAQKLYQEAREEHSTDYLLHMDPDLDDPSVAILSKTEMRQKGSKKSVNRSDSVESTEGKFVPNAIAKCHSSESINQGNVDIDVPVFTNEEVTDEFRPRSQSYSGEKLSQPNTLFIVPHHDYVVDSSPAVSPRSETSEQQSPNVSPKIRRRSPVNPAQKPKPIKVIPRHESSSSSDATDGTLLPGNNVSGNHKHLILPNKPLIEGIQDDQLKGKLNQRRMSRGEKRYHTADSIQDIQKQETSKDTAIHKRLSWHLGAVDINIDDRTGILKNKTFSSDSLRSVPSSSGVSSTQSLHLSPDSEICEENELDLQNADSTGIEGAIQLFTDIVESETDTEATLVGSPSERPTNSGDEEEDDTDMPSGGHFESDRLAVSARSKSMSDISSIMADLSPTEVKDGISSVNLPKVAKNRNQKLSHAEILKMKKQLLLNSSAEASEV